MAVLTRKVVARVAARPDFAKAFPELESIAQLHGAGPVGSTCSRCGASQKGFDALVRALKGDSQLSVRLRDYLGFQSMDLVERVDKNRVEVVKLA